MAGRNSPTPNRIRSMRREIGRECLVMKVSIRLWIFDFQGHWL
jgi:hypothetical protein